MGNMCHSNFLSFLHKGWDFMSEYLSVIICHHFLSECVRPFCDRTFFFDRIAHRKKLLSLLYIKIDRSIYKFIRLSDIDIAMKKHIDVNRWIGKSSIDGPFIYHSNPLSPKLGKLTHGTQISYSHTCAGTRSTRLTHSTNLAHSAKGTHTMQTSYSTTLHIYWLYRASAYLNFIAYHGSAWTIPLNSK